MNESDIEFSKNGLAHPVIGVTASSEEAVKDYCEAIEEAQGTPHPIVMKLPLETEATLDSIHGLLLTGGADVDPSHYGQQADPAARVRSNAERDAAELPLIRAALKRDMPVFAICRGMQALNVVLGGSLIQDLPGHGSGAPGMPLQHEIFVPPGVRLTTILGLAGFMKVNSYHHQGFRLAGKAPGLMVSAYSTLKDGIIEGVESPNYRWLLGVQWHPERRAEVPKAFRNLFLSFVAAARGPLDET